MPCDLYCYLLPQSEALRTCRSGFPIATTGKHQLNAGKKLRSCCYFWGLILSKIFVNLMRLPNIFCIQARMQSAFLGQKCG